VNVTVITMTDGKVFTGRILAFFPKEGWLSISDEAAPEKILLSNIYSGLTFIDTVRGVTGKVDVKERALESGWDGT
jgi:hypothetical protein